MKKIILFAFVFTLLIGAGHYFAFPSESKCILVPLSGMEKRGHVYVRTGTPKATTDSLHQLLNLAYSRLDSFWGKRIGSPTIIFCDREEDFLAYSGFATPAAAKFKFGGYVIISADGLSADIIAHELSHIELYERIGFWKNLSFPIWLHEGIAMQVDYRPDFEVKGESYVIPQEELAKLPHLIAGSTTLNYASAKFHVRNMLASRNIDEVLILSME